MTQQTPCTQRSTLGRDALFVGLATHRRRIVAGSCRTPRPAGRMQRYLVGVAPQRTVSEGIGVAAGRLEAATGAPRRATKELLASLHAGFKVGMGPRSVVFDMTDLTIEFEADEATPRVVVDRVEREPFGARARVTIAAHVTCEACGDRELPWASPSLSVLHGGADG